MPKDAKFGLTLGVGCVVLIAALFFPKEPARPNRTIGAPAVSAPVGTPKANSSDSKSASQYSLAPAR